MKRRIALLGIALFVFGVGTIAWTLVGLPPVKHYLRESTASL